MKINPIEQPIKDQFVFKTIDSFNKEITFRFNVIENTNANSFLIKTKLSNGENFQLYYVGYTKNKVITAFKKELLQII